MCFNKPASAEFFCQEEGRWRRKFGKKENLIDRSEKHLLFYWHFRIVI